MRQLFTSVLAFFLLQINGQTTCYHIDCGCVLPDGISASEIKLDTSYIFNSNLIYSEQHKKYNKDSTWIWQMNFQVNHYSVKHTKFQTDTVLLSEGFVFNKKKNDIWITNNYIQADINLPCYNSINVTSMFYLNDTPIISLCKSSLFNREKIQVNFQTSEISIKYPMELIDTKSEMDTFIYISIDCIPNSLGEIECIGKTGDEDEIFRVSGYTLEDELSINFPHIIRRKLIFEKE